MHRLLAFIYGVLAAFGSLLLESVLLIIANQNPALAGATAILIGSAVEESLKLLFFLQFTRRYLGGLSRFDTALFLGLGFGVAELFLVTSISGFESILSTDLLPALGILLVHTFTPLLYVLVDKKLAGIRWRLLLGWLLMIGAHAVYNLFILL